MSSIILDLLVRNHPGTMSHITGLFVRRGFNLDAIRCAPVGDGSESRLFLLVTNRPRLRQIECQLSRLHDVLAIRFRPDLTEAFFRIEDTAYSSCPGNSHPSQSLVNKAFSASNSAL